MTLSVLAATKTHIDLAFAAVEYETERFRASRLKAARNACRCELAEADEPEVGYRGQPACWKNYSDDGERDAERDWCPTCRRRQRLHLEYRKAAKVRGARMRSFQRIAQRGIDLQAIDKEVRAMEQEHEGATETDKPAAGEQPTEGAEKPTEATEENGAKTEA